MAARDVAILAQRLIQDFPKTLDTAKISKRHSVKVLQIELT